MPQRPHAGDRRVSTDNTVICTFQHKEPHSQYVYQEYELEEVSLQGSRNIAIEIRTCNPNPILKDLP